MSVTPINITRVSNNMRSLSLLQSLRQNTLNLFLEQSRLASGNKLNAPSDDPVAASQALNMTELLEHQDQVLANIHHADSFLSATDSAVGGISDLLIQARSIASEMVNSTTDQSQRDSSAELILGILNEAVRTGNRQYAGIYLFGGQQTTRQPFVQDAGGVQYLGDTNSLTSRVDLQQDAQINFNGAELFGALSSQVAGNVDLNPALTPETRLVDVAGAAGNGVQRGSVRVSLDTPATTFVVDLSQADDIGDVVNAFNNAAADAGLTVGAGNQFNATLNANHDGLLLTAGAGTVTASEVGDGLTARDLGIVGSGAPALAGTDLRPLIVPTTTIASLFGGAGATLGSIQIQNGSTTATIDLSGATTIQDLLNKINSAGAQVQATINADGTGINVINRMSGARMSIGEAGGTTAGLLGIRSMYGQTLLSSLNRGNGISTVAGKADFRIVAKDGTTVDVSLTGAKTIQDVLDKINTAATTAGVAVSASLATTGNGIRIVDATGGAGTLQIQRQNLSAAIDGLGLNKTVANPGDTQLVSDDTGGIEPNSIFGVLSDLFQALQAGDTAGISDAGDRLGGFIDQVNRMHGIIGARSQAMTNRLNLTDDAVTATKKLLSDVKDLDYTEAVTRFQQAQTTLQANLLTGSKLLQLSLLDFISP